MMEIAASHVQLSCVHGNLMIDLAATNEELRDRAARLLIANPRGRCGVVRVGVGSHLYHGA